MPTSPTDEILAFDPGGTTGVARCVLPPTPQYDPLSLWHFDAWQIGHPDDSHHVELDRMLYDRLPSLIVCEEFAYRPYAGDDDEAQPRRAHLNLVSKEYIGVIKHYSYYTGTPLVMQAPSTGLQFVKDKRLKSLGLHIPGRNHANDATRHLLYYLVFTRKFKDPFVSLWKSGLTSPNMVES